MMDWNRLKALRAREPYAGLSGAEAVAALNAKTVTRRQLVPLWRAKKAGMEAGYWMAIEKAAENPSASGHAVAKAAIRYYADLRFDNLDMDLPEVQTMFQGLVASGLMTAAQAEELDGMADLLVSPAEADGLEPVTLYHIQRAEVIGNG